MRLTDAFVKNLKFEGEKTRYFDDALPNFGVRVYKSGVSFVLLTGPTRKQTTIGRYPAISLKEARTKAITLLGTMPSDTSNISVSDALSDFISYAEGYNSPRTASDYKRLLNKHFPQGTLHKLLRSQILARLEALSNVPGERSHATTAFQVFLNWCVHNGYLDYNPIAGLRNQGKIQKRDRVLTDEEVKSVWDVLTDDRFSTIVRLMILTGQRRGEIPYMQLDGEVVSIPKEHTKNKREHVFPIGNCTVQYLVPVQFNGWSKAKLRLDEQSGVNNWVLHDLRRTYATKHAELGTPIHVIEKLLNHVSGTLSGVAGIYNRYSYMDEMKDAVQRYEDWLQSAVLRQV